MKHFSLLLALGALLLAGSPLSALTPVITVQKDPELLAEGASHSNVDLVLCLDTSNSMDGLIDSAKLQLWNIVNTLAKADPAPKLRVALFSYGNDGYSQENGWVRNEVAFTEDLDLVYEKLFSLKTNGGQEYVSRVTRAALQQSWTPGDDKVLRLIFVAGNESAAQDPTFTLESVMAEAAAQKVFVNTIFCENPTHGDADGWRQAAVLGTGRFAAIDPNHQVAYVTPYDEKLAALSGRLNSTYIFYGDVDFRVSNGLRQVAQDSNAGLMSSNASAERAVAKSSALYDNRDRDLVDLYSSDKEKALSNSADQLPEELKGKTKEEIEAYILTKKEERTALQNEINELNKARLQNIEEQKTASQPTGEALDSVMIQALREQAKTKGITIP